MTPIKLSLLSFLLLSLTALGQHDPGRNSVRLLAVGKTDEAIELVAKGPNKRNSPISDADRLLVLAMAACKNGDAAGAFALVKQSVEAGLPLARLYAGPRDIFEPLFALDEFKAWAGERPQPLLHGPMLTVVTDTSASFWVRTHGEAEVEVIAEPAVQGAPSTGTARTSAGRDFTGVVTIAELSPATRYSYRVRMNGRDVGTPATFQTFAPEGRPGKFSIAFGGGAGFTPQYERMWTTINKRNPTALLLLGDNVYIDDPEQQVTQQYCYYRRQSQAEWRQLVGSTSVFTIYDDHDFGMNDCVPGPDIDHPAWKRPVWETFTHNWNNPGYGGGPEQPGCWYDFHIGDVHFIMLDCRYYRDLEGGSMLGPAQKEWLFETLKNSKGTFKVLASSVPWSPGVKPGSKDTWDGFADERDAIFSFLTKHKLTGVVLMAADRHRTDLRRIARPDDYPLYEVMSSRLTNVHTHGLMEEAKGSEFLMGYNKEPSFGSMEFDTAAEEPSVRYDIINIDNEVVGTHTIKLGELK
jgi:alkaline phosphatase D